MLPKQEKTGAVIVVDIGSSDDEEDVGAERRKASPRGTPLQTGAKQTSSRPISPQGSSNQLRQTQESRSFWKAGAYNVGPAKFAPATGLLVF